MMIKSSLEAGGSCRTLDLDEGQMQRRDGNGQQYRGSASPTLEKFNYLATSLRSQDLGKGHATGGLSTSHDSALLRPLSKGPRLYRSAWSPNPFHAAGGRQRQKDQGPPRKDPASPSPALMHSQPKLAIHLALDRWGMAELGSLDETPRFLESFGEQNDSDMGHMDRENRVSSRMNTLRAEIKTPPESQEMLPRYLSATISSRRRQEARWLEEVKREEDRKQEERSRQEREQQAKALGVSKRYFGVRVLSSYNVHRREQCD